MLDWLMRLTTVLILGGETIYLNGEAVLQTVIWYPSKNDLDAFCLSACQAIFKELLLHDQIETGHVRC